MNGERKDAIASIDQWIGKLGGLARKLTNDEVRSRRRMRIVAGWRLSVEIGSGVREIDVCLDEFFPRSAAHAFLVAPPKPLTWPHVQKDGLLCLIPSISQVDILRPIDNVAEVIGMAVSLIEELVGGHRQEDFREEFDSYWTQSIQRNSRLVLSLLSPRPPSRNVVLFRSRDYDLVGESEQDVREWIGNRTGKKRAKLQLGIAKFIWIEKPWLPEEYPKNAKAVLNLAELAPSQAHPPLQQWLFNDMQPSTVVVGATTGNGPCLAAVTLYPPGNPQGRRPLDRGFRPGRMPWNVFRARATSSTISRSLVCRVDSAWIHGRGKNPQQGALRESRVGVVGCGSIGAAVAVMLAQAGVGELVLVDPDILSPANIGRHPLGAEYLFKPKAVALREQIAQRFPHIREIRAIDLPSEDAVRKAKEDLDGCDLIVSAMGNWGSESALNEWHLLQNRASTIVYGWTEPFACAGHAVAVRAKGGCLQCGMSSGGQPKLSVAEWPGETLKREPGCGTFFQPYGPIELSHINSMIAEMAVDCLLGSVQQSQHRVWVGRQSLISASGGSLTQNWKNLEVVSGMSSACHQLDWPEDANCMCTHRRK